MGVTGLEGTIKWYDEHAEQYAEAGATYFDMNHITTQSDYPEAQVFSTLVAALDGTQAFLVSKT